jgi:hypothetical protein
VGLSARSCHVVSNRGAHTPRGCSLLRPVWLVFEYVAGKIVSGDCGLFEGGAGCLGISALPKQMCDDNKGVCCIAVAGLDSQVVGAASRIEVVFLRQMCDHATAAR